MYTCIFLYVRSNKLTVKTLVDGEKKWKKSEDWLYLNPSILSLNVDNNDNSLYENRVPVIYRVLAPIMIVSIPTSTWDYFTVCEYKDPCHYNPTSALYM